MVLTASIFQDIILGTFSLMNSYVFFAVLIFGLWAYLSMRKDTSNRAALAAITLLLAFSLSLASKDYYRIERPCTIGGASLIACPIGEYSFPSIHTAVAFALALPFIGTVAFLPLLALAFITAFGRIYLGLHTPYDIAGGIALAVLCFGISWGLSLRARQMLLSPRLGAHTYAKAASENLRQFLHICIGIFAILILAFLGKEAAQYIFFAGLLASIVLLDLLLRKTGMGFLSSVFNMLSRAKKPDYHEYDLGLIWLLGGILLVLLVLNDAAATVSLVALGIGDSLSTFFGKQGKNKLPHNHMKTWEGWLSMFGCCLPSIFLFGWVGVVWAVLVAFVESLPFKIDDNLTIALFCIIFFSII